MFVARQRELAFLEECYEAPCFQMIPVWGRRRVGKTRLLNEFVAGKPRVHFFTAAETTARENLARLSAALLSWYDADAELAGVRLDGPVFPSYDAALAHAFTEANDQRCVLVIDEYPYLAKSYPGISSLLQQLIDANKDRSALMIVLCGSSMIFMEHQVLGEKSPLYGRRTGQLKVEPFDYLDAAQLLDTYDPIRTIELYALVGGVPLYLEQLDARHSTEWNLAQKMLGQGCLIYAEPNSLLLQEVTNPAPYAAVIGAIASGHPRPNEIADATGIAGPNVNEYLKRLGELGIVSRETPVGRANRRQVVYTISDQLFRFWYSFVPRYGQAIELGQGARVANRISRQELPTYVGHAFEKICRQWLARHIAGGVFDMLPTRIGSWWGADAMKREPADVDVVALGSSGEVICGECKWTADPVGAEVVETLERRAQSVEGRPTSLQLLVFSKAGFADSAKREAQRAGNVRLVSVEDMLEIPKAQTGSEGGLDWR